MLPAKKSPRVRAWGRAKEKSYFNNNVLVARVGDGPLVGFEDEESGVMAPTFVRMNSYAIIPAECYEGLLLIKSLATIPPEPSAKT